MADRGRTEQQVGKCFSSHVVFRRRVLFYVYNTEIYTLAVRMLTPFDDVELRNLVKSAKFGVLTRRVIKPALTRHGVIVPAAKCRLTAHRIVQTSQAVVRSGLSLSMFRQSTGQIKSYGWILVTFSESPAFETRTVYFSGILFWGIMEKLGYKISDRHDWS